MKRMLGLVLLALFSVNLLGAQESHTFYLSTSARAGRIQLPRGICEWTWNRSRGSWVQLLVKTDDEKTVTIPARMVEGKQDKTGVVTSVLNNVRYVEELHTKNAKFIIQNRADDNK